MHACGVASHPLDQTLVRITYALAPIRPGLHLGGSSLTGPTPSGSTEGLARGVPEEPAVPDRDGEIRKRTATC